MRHERSYHVTTILDGPDTRTEIRDCHNQVVATFRGDHAYGKAKRLLRQLEDSSVPPEPRPMIRISARERAA